ncbi:hypothetical protein BJ875DRAFT_459423 [Amylocarpus encephaloides]|uniref:Uncharacterized protein n=1 Tax=Amylocarpus encephaloides TaxID=45428 RepID=A0A9P7YK39_9HELO|nr:hypothetical protein BJ875DRAFT_459423 [Amylocarpus encephaloides]
MKAVITGATQPVHAHIFCVGVAAPSVPARQLSILFLFAFAMYLLKQALALMTALQLSESASQGPSARTDETNRAKRPNDMRIVKICFCFNFVNAQLYLW